MANADQILAAARRYGPSVDHVARRYGLSGTALLAKLIKGESVGRSNAVSHAGARGLTQFMPATRKAMIDKYGVDPWRSVDEAVHGAALHLRGKLGHKTGLEGYNPGGGQQYVRYILGQKVGDVSKGARRGGSSRGGEGGGGTPGAPGAYDPGTPAEANLQGADLTSLLAALGQSRRPQRTITAPAPPAFAARAVMPRFAPLAAGSSAPQPPAPSPLEAMLEAIRTPGGDVATGGRGATGTAPVPGTGGGSAEGGPAGVSGGRAGLLRGRSGKLIGVPHSGTHTLGNWQSDNAIDLGAPEGTIIQMPRGGVVEKVGGSYRGGRSRFDGYQVTVRLDNGRRVFMTHLSKTHVRPGQRLRAGQAVGRVGSANGVPHLHLGVDRGDPRKLFGR